MFCLIALMSFVSLSAWPKYFFEEKSPDSDSHLMGLDDWFEIFDAEDDESVEEDDNELLNLEAASFLLNEYDLLINESDLLINESDVNAIDAIMEYDFSEALDDEDEDFDVKHAQGECDVNQIQADNQRRAHEKNLYESRDRDESTFERYNLKRTRISRPGSAIDFNQNQ